MKKPKLLTTILAILTMSFFILVSCQMAPHNDGVSDEHIMTEKVISEDAPSVGQRAALPLDSHPDGPTVIVTEPAIESPDSPTDIIIEPIENPELKFGEPLTLEYEGKSGSYHYFLLTNLKVDPRIYTARLLDSNGSEVAQKKSDSFRTYLKFVVHVNDIKPGRYRGSIANHLSNYVQVSTEPTGWKVRYKGHQEGYGDLGFKIDGAELGHTGVSKRLEAINIEVSKAIGGGGIEYQVHLGKKTIFDNGPYGWQPIRKNGEQAGTKWQSRRMEAIKIRLINNPNYRVRYRVHTRGDGWEKTWRYDWQISGTTGEHRRIESIIIEIVKK